MINDKIILVRSLRGKSRQTHQPFENLALVLSQFSSCNIFSLAGPEVPRETSQLPHRWLRRCLLGRQRNTSNLLIDFPLLRASQVHWILSTVGKLSCHVSGEERAKAGNYPALPPTERTQVFNEKRIWCINKPPSFKNCISKTYSTGLLIWPSLLSFTLWKSLLTYKQKLVICIQKHSNYTRRMQWIQTFGCMSIFNTSAFVVLYWGGKQPLDILPERPNRESLAWTIFYEGCWEYVVNYSLVLNLE